MATNIELLPAYGGILPDKDTQEQDVFDGAADSWIQYEYSGLVLALNNDFVPSLNLLSTELEVARNLSITYAGLSQTYANSSQLSAVDSENSNVAAASSASSAGTALAAANAILGLDIGTAFVDASGHLNMTYNAGVVTPSLDTNGHFTLEY